MRTKPFFQLFMAAGLLLGCALMVSCDITVNGTVTKETSADSSSIKIKGTIDAVSTPLEDETDETVVETEVVTEPESYTRESMAGIYDTDDNDRLCFDEDGTGSSGRIGSLNFTSFDYFVDGDEIIITWGDESESRLKIRDGGKSVYWPENDLTFIKEE
jgi:hypothetical protein